jgi:carboxyl-terminal processing protease
MPFPPYGAIRLTTARYYTPSGRSIQALGIEPDIKVQQSKVEAIDQPAFAVRSEAALKGALKNDTLKKKDGKDKTDKDAKPDDKGATPLADAGKDAKPADGKDGDKDAKPADNPLDAFTHFGDPTNDYQLSRAIDLLHGLSLYKGVASKTN